MADISEVTRNRTLLSARAEASRKRILIGAVGVCLVVGASIAVSPFGAGASALMAFVGLAAFGTAVLSVAPDPAQLASARGQLLTLQELTRLPSTYHVFNQVDIPNPRSRTGFSEADLIVTGPNGVFVIEVKHDGGKVRGGASQREWSVRKSGRRSGRYEKTMQNPLLQVGGLVHLLTRQLDARGRGRGRSWVQGIVVFSNDAAELDIRGVADVRCLRLHQLCEYVMRFPARGANGANTDARGTLRAIKAKAA